MQVWADVKKKHSSHAVTSDVSLAATAEAVEFMRADAVVITGAATGEPPRADDVREARRACRLPVVLGSGVDARNIADFFPDADAFIIGSYFKVDGHWANPVDARRVEKLMEVVKRSARAHAPGEPPRPTPAANTIGGKLKRQPP